MVKIFGKHCKSPFWKEHAFVGWSAELHIRDESRQVCQTFSADVRFSLLIIFFGISAILCFIHLTSRSIVNVWKKCTSHNKLESPYWTAFAASQPLWSVLVTHVASVRTAGRFAIIKYAHNKLWQSCSSSAMLWNFLFFVGKRDPPKPSSGKQDHHLCWRGIQIASWCQFIITCYWTGDYRWKIAIWLILVYLL